MNQVSAISVDVPATATLDSSAWNLVLAASLPEPGKDDYERMRTLLELPVDWEAALRLADDHGTSALVYRNLSQLSDEVPAVAREGLRKRCERNVHRSLFLARELVRILDCVNALGIRVIPYKGAVLSEVYYGDMAARQCGDMDLLVRKQDAARIKIAVRELGYTPRMNIPRDSEQGYLDSGYEYTFDSPAGKNLLELQWALQPRFYAADFDMEGLFKRAVDVTVGGRPVKTLSAEDLLLVLCVHAAKHVWGRLIWLCDIAQIVKRKKLNWDWVREQAREVGIERIVHISLLLAGRFVRMEMPEGIEHAALADGTAQEFAEEIAGAIAGGLSYGEDQVAYFRLMIRLRERKIDRVRFLTRLTFTPGPGEWETVRLPKVLHPFYRVVRLARLGARFMRG